MLKANPAFERVLALAEGRVSPDKAAQEMATFLRTDLPAIEVSNEHVGKKFEGYSHPVGPCQSCGGKGKIRCATCGGSGRWRVNSGAELAFMLELDSDLKRWFLDQLRRAGASYSVLSGFPVDLPCLDCKGNGYKPCPRSEEMVFEVPYGAQSGWILAGRNITKREPIFAVARRRH